MIKALFFDMDGTLLTPEGKISEETKLALKECRAKGIKVFAATARPPLLAEMLHLSKSEARLIADGGVFYNGACIWCNEQKFYTYLPESAVKTAVETISAYEDVNTVVQLADEKHSFRFEVTEEALKGWGVAKDKLIPLAALPHDQAVRVFAFSAQTPLPPLYEKLRTAVGDKANVFLLQRGGFSSIEILPKGVNKKLAIDRLLDICNLTPDEAAVFGDDINDIEMLQGFTYSVAMGNAREEVKRHANFITRSNAEEGISYALRKVLKVI